MFVLPVWEFGYFAAISRITKEFRQIPPIGRRLSREFFSPSCQGISRASRTITIAATSCELSGGRLYDLLCFPFFPAVTWLICRWDCMHSSYCGRGMPRIALTSHGVIGVSEALNDEYRTILCLGASVLIDRMQYGRRSTDRRVQFFCADFRPASNACVQDGGAYLISVAASSLQRWAATNYGLVDRLMPRESNPVCQTASPVSWSLH